MLVLLLQQIGVVCLVILDALLVLGELLMDLKIIHPDRYNITPKVKCEEMSTCTAVPSLWWLKAPWIGWARQALDLWPC